MFELMTRTIEKYKMLDPGDMILVAISGGADSVALIHLLSQCCKLVAVHVNHNLRGDESMVDEEFVRGLCSELDIPLQVYSVDVLVEKSKGLSLEEAARQLRYASVSEAAKLFGANKTAIAHNKNDNAETIILNLCRGTGLKGMGGIAPVRDGIIRPLIEIDRKTIETYLHENDIPYRTDSSNSDENISRNRVRHSVIPVLETINPKLVALISNSASLLREEETYLEMLATQALEECLQASADSSTVLSLHVSALLQHPVVMQRRILRAALLRANTKKGLNDYSYAHIEQLLSLLGENKTGKKIRLPGDIQARREYESLFIGFASATSSVTSAPFCFDIPLDEPVFIPALKGYVHASCTVPMTNSLENSSEICTKHFNYDKIKGILQVRSRCLGDCIAIFGGGRKKLQDEFIDRKVPRATRDSIPLLAIGSDILWIMDSSQRTNAAFQPETGCSVLTVSIDNFASLRA